MAHTCIVGILSDYLEDLSDTILIAEHLDVLNVPCSAASYILATINCVLYHKKVQTKTNGGCMDVGTYISSFLGSIGCD